MVAPETNSICTRKPLLILKKKDSLSGVEHEFDVLEKKSIDNKDVYKIRVWRGLNAQEAYQYRPHGYEYEPNEQQLNAVYKFMAKKINEGIVPPPNWWGLNKEYVQDFFARDALLAGVITLECQKGTDITENAPEDKDNPYGDEQEPTFNKKKCKITGPDNCKIQINWDSGTIECDGEITKSDSKLCEFSEQLAHLLDEKVKLGAVQI